MELLVTELYADVICLLHLCDRLAFLFFGRIVIKHVKENFNYKMGDNNSSQDLSTFWNLRNTS